ncbi:MAG: family ATP-binding cassette protein [Thermoleophilia bacterium]|nr:family ATP-binding cassette protein [Thermoleophilia bacterium]
MSDLIASNLGVTFGARPLFSDISLTVDPGDRVALVGPNGAGKTTLLRVLSRQMNPTAGDLHVPAHIHVALHDQRPERDKSIVREWVAPPRLVALEKELRILEASMADGDPAKLDAWQEVRTRYDQLGGENWIVLVEQVLRGLGFREEQMDQPLDSLSGGELTRASLARALASSPDVLLLDEPTNHLDIDTISWLQDHLSSLKGGLVLVSHDRWFIEAVCTSVIEIAHGRGRRFNGSFVEYRAQQAMEAVTHGRELEKWQGEVARLQRFVDRFGSGTRSRQAQSRAKVLDKLRQDVPAYANISERASIGFQLPKMTKQPGRTVFEVKGLALGFDGEGDTEGRELLEPSDFVIERGEKIVILGPNGAGKSTLLHALASKCVMHEEAPGALRAGEVVIGYDVQARLLSQHDSELVDDQSMLGNMNLAAPGISRTDAQNLLGLFGFRGDDAQKLVGALSGGERRRLMMAMALTGADNVLLLDEPTNHLDIESREGLEAALADWGGTMIMVSHDRALVEGVATRTLVLHDKQLITIVGGYEQAHAVLSGETDAPAQDPGAVLRQQAAKEAEAARRAAKGGSKSKSATVNAPGTPGTSGAAGSSDSGTRTVKRREKGAPRDGSAKVRRPATVEAEIERFEQELAAVNEAMLDPDVFTDAAKSAELLERHAKLERGIAAGFTELEKSTEVFGS